MGYSIIEGPGSFAKCTPRYDDSRIPVYDPLEYTIDIMMGGQEDYGELYMRDNRADFMDAWMAPNEILESVPRVDSIGLIVPAKGEDNRANVGGVKVTGTHAKLNMRDTGLYLTLEHDFRARLVNYMQSEDGYGLAAYLNNRGYNAEDVDVVGIGFVDDQTIFEVVKYIDGSVGIKANRDYFKIIENEAKHHDMDTNELMEAIIAEEFTHLFRGLKPRFSDIAEEKATKTTVRDYYLSLEKAATNKHSRERYERMVRRLDHDIATVDRYSEMYHSDRGKLEMILEAEARMEMGITDDNEVRDYVAERMESIAEASEKENKGYDSKICAEEAATEGETEACTAECAAAGEAPSGDEGGGDTGGEGGSGAE